MVTVPPSPPFAASTLAMFAADASNPKLALRFPLNTVCSAARIPEIPGGGTIGAAATFGGITHNAGAIGASADQKAEIESWIFWAASAFDSPASEDRKTASAGSYTPAVIAEPRTEAPAKYASHAFAISSIASASASAGIRFARPDAKVVCTSATL